MNHLHEGNPMKTKLTATAAILTALTFAACSKEAPPRPPPPPEPPVAAPLRLPPEPAPVPPVHPDDRAAGVVPKAPSPAPVAAAPKPAPTAQPAPAPAAASPTYSSVHGKVGDAKCKMCHRLQHDSWSASPHAKKGLDCEGCHGGGADFTKVMRDRTAAIAAGLVLPRKEFCKGCHKKDWQDAMFLRVHAHKVK
jgi:hypothetical protein